MQVQRETKKQSQQLFEEAQKIQTQKTTAMLCAGDKRR
jgi:hypothetical protein